MTCKLNNIQHLLGLALKIIKSKTLCISWGKTTFKGKKCQSSRSVILCHLKMRSHTIGEQLCLQPKKWHNIMWGGCQTVGATWCLWCQMSKKIRTRPDIKKCQLAKWLQLFPPARQDYQCSKFSQVAWLCHIRMWCMEAPGIWLAE